MHALRGCATPVRWKSCARAVPSNASTSAPAQAGHPAQSPTQATPPKPSATGLEQKFQNSFTMSQVYVKDRPPPIPLSDFESRRRTRDLEEICSAGKKRGVSAEVVKANMAQIDVLMPGLVNLHKAKAADWLLILLDVNQFMSKLILLRELFPAANLQKVLSAQPKLLLKTTDQLRDDGKQVRAMLAAAPEPDAIIEAVPDLMNPLSLARSLNHLQTVFKGCDPVAMLVKNPTILLNMGEADIADNAEPGDFLSAMGNDNYSAEYGELSTKD